MKNTCIYIVAFLHRFRLYNSLVLSCFDSNIIGLYTVKPQRCEYLRTRANCSDYGFAHICHVNKSCKHFQKLRKTSGTKIQFHIHAYFVISDGIWDFAIGSTLRPTEVLIVSMVTTTLKRATTIIPGLLVISVSFEHPIKHIVLIPITLKSYARNCRLDL